MKAKKLILIPALALMASSALADTAPADSPVSKTNADNTELNKRDVGASSNTLTPPDQSKGTKTDVELTRRIRELVVKDDSLSTKARNVKIVTLRGITTLRGPVENTEERAKVASIASQVVGGENFVRNQLEVKTPK